MINVDMVVCILHRATSLSTDNITLALFRANALIGNDTCLDVFPIYPYH